MKILILEDETLAGEKLENLLKDIDQDLDIVDKLKSVESALEWFEINTHPELIISDIRLLDGLSFEIFEKIDYTGPVIFTTAYDQYAIKAFEVNSIDYLLKPIQREKLETSIKKLKSNAQQSGDNALRYNELIQLLSESKSNYKSRFMIRAGNKILAVPVEKIAYFYSLNKLTYIIVHDGKKYPFDQPLDNIDQQLDPRSFFRVNRKYIAAFTAISEIHPYFKGRIKLHLTPPTEDEIVISADKTLSSKNGWINRGLLSRAFSRFGHLILRLISNDYNRRIN